MIRVAMAASIIAIRILKVLILLLLFFLGDTLLQTTRPDLYSNDPFFTNLPGDVSAPQVRWLWAGADRPAAVFLVEGATSNPLGWANPNTFRMSSTPVGQGRYLVTYGQREYSVAIMGVLLIWALQAPLLASVIMLVIAGRLRMWLHELRYPAIPGRGPTPLWKRMLFTDWGRIWGRIRHLSGFGRFRALLISALTVAFTILISAFWIHLPGDLRWWLSFYVVCFYVTGITMVSLLDHAERWVWSWEWRWR